MTDVRIRSRLSDLRLWIGIAYFLLAFVLVTSLVDYGHAQKALASSRKIEVQRDVEQAAARQARIVQCIASIPFSRKIDSFLSGVRTFHVVVTQNAKAILDATPKDSPEYAVRLRNWRRVAETVPLVSGIHFPIQTKAKCRAAG